MAISRLWRKLGLTQPLVRVWTEVDSSFEMNDRDIKSITITRGSAGSTTGLQEHTMEVNTVANRPSRTDRPLHCDLTTYGANRIQQLTGQSASTIKQRYYGRLGKQVINDGGGGWNVNNWHTDFYCSKWQSQLENSDRLGNQIDQNEVHYLMNHFMNPGLDTDLDYMPAPEFLSPTNTYGIMNNSYELGEAKIPYSEFASKYLNDPGYYVQNKRSGADRVLTMKYRWTLANNRLASWMPLTRSHVLSPTKWEQPNEDRPRNHVVLWRKPEGIWKYVVGPNPDDVRIPTVEHDLSYIKYYDDWNPKHLAAAGYGQERFDSGYRLPSMQIDLLRLLDTNEPSRLKQAAQLLYMEMGDPVYLSGDWYPSLTGIHFASGIKETITPDRWDIELSLDPAIAVVGEWARETVPAQTWESALYPWDDATYPWT